MEASPVGEGLAGRPAAVVDTRLDRVVWGGGGEDECNQAFVPAVDRVVHRPSVHRAPMPKERVRAAGEPVPFNVPPKRIDEAAQDALLGFRTSEILPRRKQPRHQICRLDDVAAVVAATEGYG